MRSSSDRHVFETADLPTPDARAEDEGKLGAADSAPHGKVRRTIPYHVYHCGASLRRLSCMHETVDQCSVLGRVLGLVLGATCELWTSNGTRVLGTISKRRYSGLAFRDGSMECSAMFGFQHLQIPPL